MPVCLQIIDPEIDPVINLGAQARNYPVAGLIHRPSLPIISTPSLSQKEQNSNIQTEFRECAIQATAVRFGLSAACPPG
jgi:hypothetical protein